MSTWSERDYLPGATIPTGGTARRNKTGNWRTAAIPLFKRAICEACPRPAATCPTYCEDCSVACHRDCLLCWVSCPDACIVLDDGNIKEINLDYCKGCGICAAVCPRGAIEMMAKNEG